MRTATTPLVFPRPGRFAPEGRRATLADIHEAAEKLDGQPPPPQAAIEVLFALCAKRGAARVYDRMRIGWLSASCETLARNGDA
jgi:hypothetical protein